MRICRITLSAAGRLYDIRLTAPNKAFQPMRKYNGVRGRMARMILDSNGNPIRRITPGSPLLCWKPFLEAAVSVALAFSLVAVLLPLQFKLVSGTAPGQTNLDWLVRDQGARRSGAA